MFYKMTTHVDFYMILMGCYMNLMDLCMILNVRIEMTMNVRICMTTNVRMLMTRNVRMYMTSNEHIYLTRACFLFLLHRGALRGVGGGADLNMVFLIFYPAQR